MKVWVMKAFDDENTIGIKVCATKEIAENIGKKWIKNGLWVRFILCEEEVVENE